MLTLYRIGCMAETTVTTRDVRRDIQAYQTSTPTIPAVAISAQPKAQVSKKDETEQTVEAQVLSLADQLSSGIDPTNENITVREFRFLKEINTALFALNICNSGLPLGQMCQYLKDPSIGTHLEENYINQDQAAAIVCYASVYGLFFGESNEELLADLASLEYAVQMHAYGAQSLTNLCQNLDYHAASMLGIDTNDIHQIVCDGKGGTGLNTTAVPLSTAPSFSGTRVSTQPSLTGTSAIGTAWSILGTSVPGTGWSTYATSTGTKSGPSSSLCGTCGLMSSATSG